MFRTLLLCIAYLSALSAFSQSGGADFLSVISQLCEADSLSGKIREDSTDYMWMVDAVGVMSKNVATSRNDLNVPPTREEDILSVLSAVVPDGKTTVDWRRAGSEVLSSMSDMCPSDEFYQSGAFSDRLHPDYFKVPGVLPPISGIPYHDTCWRRMTSRFGYRTKYNRMHRGVDFALNVGDTVHTAMSGVVKTVGYDAGGYGHYVVVVHDYGLETYYAHLSIPLVIETQRINEGDPIGLGGNSGNSTGPHLHFEVRYWGEAVDPAFVFDLSRRPASNRKKIKEKVTSGGNGKRVKGSVKGIK